jgi:peptidoglycan/LPS O-acetylase OafA/YrhL
MTSLISGPGFFRLALAVAVVVSHLTRIDIGRLAVLLFFYLSGYWVSRIWTEEFGGRSLLRFYQSRALRILPLFWVALIIAAVLRQQFIPWSTPWLLGLATRGGDPTSVSWSLDIELQFYLVAPILLYLLMRPERRNAAVIVTLLATAGAAAAWWFDGARSIVTLAHYLPAFALGAATYSTALQPGRRAAMVSLAAFAVLTLFIVMSPWTSSFVHKTQPDPFDRDIFGFFWMLPLLPFVAWQLTNRSNKLDRHLGNLSYPLYLLHYPLIAVIAPVGGVQKLGVMAGAFVLAVAVYVLLDRPLDRLRRAMLSREGIAVPVAP